MWAVIVSVVLWIPVVAAAVPPGDSAPPTTLVNGTGDTPPGLDDKGGLPPGQAKKLPPPVDEEPPGEDPVEEVPADQAPVDDVPADVTPSPEPPEADDPGHADEVETPEADAPLVDPDAGLDGAAGVTRSDSVLDGTVPVDLEGQTADGNRGTGRSMQAARPPTAAPDSLDSSAGDSAHVLGPGSFPSSNAYLTDARPLDAGEHHGRLPGVLALITEAGSVGEAIVAAPFALMSAVWRAMWSAGAGVAAPASATVTLGAIRMWDRRRRRVRTPEMSMLAESVS